MMNIKLFRARRNNSYAVVVYELRRLIMMIMMMITVLLLLWHVWIGKRHLPRVLRSVGARLMQWLFALEATRDRGAAQRTASSASPCHLGRQLRWCGNHSAQLPSHPCLPTSRQDVTRRDRPHYDTLPPTTAVSQQLTADVETDICWRHSQLWARQRVRQQSHDASVDRY